MSPITLDFLTQQLELSEDLRLGRPHMLEPQDLPGRFGRVVRAIDHVLATTGCEALLAGGWAVWRHGYIGRVTQDVDIVLPQQQIDEFLRVAAVSGFEVLTTSPGIWPKVRHKDTGLQVDILPEGVRPGTASRPAPTTIRPPIKMGAVPGSLLYLPLPELVELKLAAGRARDESDVIELLRANWDQEETIRRHLTAIHQDYVQAFDQLAEKAREQGAD